MIDRRLLLPMIAAASVLRPRAARAANTTWNPADKSANVTLSNGDLTATMSTSVLGGTRAATGATAGKLYFEVSLSGATGTTGDIGLKTLAGALNAHVDVYAQISDGGLWNAGSYQGFGVGVPVVGDVIGVAVNLSTKRVWFRRNNGVWNAGAGADPATNTGGLDISPTFSSVAAYPAILMQSTGLNLTGNFGASGFAFALPSGFTSWVAAGASSPFLSTLSLGIN